MAWLKDPLNHNQLLYLDISTATTSQLPLSSNVQKFNSPRPDVLNVDQAAQRILEVSLMNFCLLVDKVTII